MSTLLVTLFLGVLQVAFSLHVRTVLVSAAQEGARYAANADRTEADGVERTRQAIREALGGTVAGRMDVRPAPPTTSGGAPVVGIEVSGPLPLVVFWAAPVTLTVQGHALDEG